MAQNEEEEKAAREQLKREIERMEKEQAKKDK